MQTKTLTSDAMTHTASANSEKRRSGMSAGGAVLCAAAAFFLTGTRIGGASSPFGVSLSAALSPFYGAASLLGMFIAVMARNSLWDSISELAAALASVVFGYIFRRRAGARLRAAAAGAAYFTACAAAAADSGDWILFLAVFFRAVMCGGATYFICNTVSVIKNGFYTGSGSADGPRLRAFSLGIVYMIAVSALCSLDTGFINLGRIAAGFCICAAARKFGASGGSAAGILSAAAFLLASPAMGRSGAMLAFAGMIAGMYGIKGKYSVNTAFIISAFGVTAAAGMPSGTPGFVADAGLAASVYCLVPERFYLPRLSGIFAAAEVRDTRGDKLGFAARVLEEVGDDVQTASELFMRKTSADGDEPWSAVKSSVCGELCRQRECCAACGSLSRDAVLGCFRAAQSIAEKKGRLTPKELPAGFEGCTKKAQLADGFSRAVGIRRMRERRAADVRRFLEGSAEQLEASCGMISELSRDGRFRRDPELSKAVRRIMEDEGFCVSSAELAFDSTMTPFAEIYVRSSGRLRPEELSDASDRLAALLGVRPARPVFCFCGTEDSEVCRIRWHGETKFIPDCHISAEAAEGHICGDSAACFSDGLGHFCIILADGMGRGGRAASRSGLAVNLMRRMITAGIGRINAVKMLNVIMNFISPDEIFTTLDIFTADLQSGEGRLIKMGAAPTAVSSKKDGAFIINIYSDSSAPVGIVNGVTVTEERFDLDETSRVLMTTDGIDITSPCVAAVLENDCLTCEQAADRVMASDGTGGSPADDKTAAVFRLYRS